MREKDTQQTVPVGQEGTPFFSLEFLNLSITEVQLLPCCERLPCPAGSMKMTVASTLQVPVRPPPPPRSQSVNQRCP